MGLAKKHEFIWKYGGEKIILTGGWDNWSGNKTIMNYDAEQDVHRVTIVLDSQIDWQFKFIVDGIWRCSLDYPTVRDTMNNINNVMYAETNS